MIPPRINFLCAPVGESEMLILGGMSNDEIFGDAFEFNRVGNKVTNTRRNDVKLDFPGNQWASIRQDQIVALAIDPRKQLRIISYTRG